MKKYFTERNILVTAILIIIGVLCKMLHMMIYVMDISQYKSFWACFAGVQVMIIILSMLVGSELFKPRYK